jgi:hypothetical protein
VEENEIKLVYRGAHVDAITSRLPWVIRDPAQRNKLVDWRVLLVGDPFGHNNVDVFASVEDVNFWAEGLGDVPDDLVAKLRGFFDEPARKRLGQDDLSEAYRTVAKREHLRSTYRLLAEDEQLPLCSKKLFDVALQRGILSSLTLFNAAETSLEPIVGYCPRLPEEFVATRATCDRTSTLYDYKYPEERSQPEGKVQEIYNGGTRLPIGFVTRAARSGS